MRLEVNDLTISRGDLALAANVSFALEGGDALVVTGANGSGKSTLLRAVAGLHPPDGGTVALLEGDQSVPIGDGTHYLGHDNAMKPDLSVWENLRFWGALSGEDGVDALIGEAAEALAIERLLPLPFHVLSAGQRRRAALARLWVAPRPLWLMDEPTAALDKRSEAAVHDMIEAHRAEGGMVVAATHVDLGLDAPQRLQLGG